MELFRRKSSAKQVTEIFPLHSQIQRVKHNFVKQDDNVPGEVGNDLFESLRGYMIVGKIVGMIPVSGVSGPSYKSLQFRATSFPAVVSSAVIMLLTLRSTMAVLATITHPKKGIMDIANSIQGTVFSAWGLFCYVYFYVRVNTFLRIFDTWGNSTIFNSLKDKTFQRDTIILSIAILATAIGEFTLFNLDNFPQFDYYNGNIGRNRTVYNSTLETYYMRSSSHWNKYLGYHSIVAVMALVADLCCTFSWNYVDLLLIIFARVIYSKYEALCTVAQERLEKHKENPNINSKILSDQQTWERFVRDHDTICILLASVQKFVSALIFGTYASNMYYICMQLAYDINPGKVAKTLIRSIFSTFSFFNLIFRVLRLSLAGAKINKYAHEIGHILKRCPIEYYNYELQRLHNKVTNGPHIGLTGLGCFTITKPFILSIMGVVFTVEIVFLSSSNTMTSCSKGSG